MKLNNRGFAIASTLYTIFILFLMILLGILASLTARERMLDKSTETFASDYTTDKLDQSVVFDSVVPVSGKYVFSMAGLDSYCYSYLASGSTISNIRSLEYTTSECNNLKASTSQIDYVGVYKFYK